MDPTWEIKISILAGLVFVGISAWLYRLVVIGQCSCSCAPMCKCTCGCAPDCHCNTRSKINVLDTDPSGPLYRP